MNPLVSNIVLKRENPFEEFRELPDNEFVIKVTEYLKPYVKNNIDYSVKYNFSMSYDIYDKFTKNKKEIFNRFSNNLGWGIYFSRTSRGLELGYETPDD